MVIFLVIKPEGDNIAVGIVLFLYYIIYHVYIGIIVTDYN